MSQVVTQAIIPGSRQLTFAQIFQFGALKKIIRSEAAQRPVDTGMLRRADLRASADSRHVRM